MWKIGIWEENFMSAAFLVLQWQGENWLEKGNVEFPHSKLYTVSEKTLYHQGYSTDFQKLSLS